MKIVVLAVLLMSAAHSVAAQSRLDLALKRELDSIYAVDQRWRSMLFDQRLRGKSDSLAAALGVSTEALGPYIGRRMQQTDSSNQVRVRAILKQYGYPGKTLVGEPTNEAVWFVIQHSDDIKTYLPMMKKAAKRGELPFFLYGQMLDRQLMREGKPQVYGTQALGYNVRNPATGQREPQPPFVWPIKDAATVNERRRKAGFSTTVEQNAANLGITYRVVTLEEVARMPKE